MRSFTRFGRRGNVVALTALSGTALVGSAALSVDVGMLYNARAELQSSADAAALAGAASLLDERRLSDPASTAWMTNVRQQASNYAYRNVVQGVNPVLDQYADVRIGELSDPKSLNEPIRFDDPRRFNTAEVTVHRNSTRNGPVDLIFARVFGIDNSGLQASAAAAIFPAVGFKKTRSSDPNPGVLPLALHVNVWKDLIDHGISKVGDQYRYNPQTKTVSAGSDGIKEINLYPGSGGTQLPPGNFGTVDIGAPNNSTADISRQILHGISDSDLAYFPNGFKLNSSGYLMLNGDTGLSAGIKDELEAIKGQPRTIPLFDQVSGNGNNAMYRIVGFAGIRIVHVQLTGAMNSKSVIIQPAAVSDPTAIPGESTLTWTTMTRPQLVR